MFFPVFCLFSQKVTNNGVPFLVTIAEIHGNDTLFQHELPMVIVVPQKEFHNAIERRRYNKLVYNVKKVYPLAKTAGSLLQQYAPVLASMPNKKAKDKYFENIEKQLWYQYSSTLKKMTISQGAILIKLIDRECQRSSYDVIRDFRGKFSAFFYQAFAKLWGYNLKTEYDAVNRDRDIEEIVWMIDVGAI